jgi:hypothetical protein
MFVKQFCNVNEHSQTGLQARGSNPSDLSEITFCLIGVGAHRQARLLAKGNFSGACVYIILALPTSRELLPFE